MKDMFTLADLNDALIARIGVTSGLADIQGKSGFGILPEGLSRPKCRFGLISDTIQGTYGDNLLSSVRYQFSVFADNLSTATGLQAGLINAFHNVALSLSDGTIVRPRVLGGRRLLIEGQESVGYVYHATCDFEFRILS